MNIAGHLAELFIAYIQIKIWKLAGFRFPSMLNATPSLMCSDVALMEHSCHWENGGN